MSNQIQIPPILIEQSEFCVRIDENNSKMFEHIDYLRQLVTNMHKVYLQLCRRITAHSEQCERRILSCKDKTCHATTMLNFVKSMNFLHMSIHNQLNNNNVTLGTKTHIIAKKRLEILHDKLLNSHSLNQLYLDKVNIYNQKQHKFRQRCNYFKDYEKDVLKYYSLKENTELYETLATKEVKLKAKLEEIYQIKDEYKINISEIRVTQKQYFDMQNNIINEYKKLLLNIRKNNQNNNQIYNQPILQESEDNTSTVLEHPIKSTKVQKPPLDRTVTNMRRDVTRDLEKSLQVQQHIEQFIAKMQEQIAAAGQRIDSIRSTNQFQNFIAQKLVMSEILSIESIRDIDSIVNEISCFRSIILNLTSLFGKLKVLKQLKKYRGFNYNKFIEETNQQLETERKEGPSLLLRNAYKSHEEKFERDHAQHMSSVREKIMQLQNDILREYYRQDDYYEQLKYKKTFSNDLFEKKHFRILKHHFFISKEQNQNFSQNEYLKKFSTLLNANQIQNMMTLSNFKKKEKRHNKIACCGLIRLCENEEEAHELIDDYHCALKDGMVLIQGKLNLYSNYLHFTSNFNSKTLFGRSDIRIPKWDISQFVKAKHLLSQKIVLETTHGKIEFTSFLHSPYDQLIQLYNDRKSGMSFIDKQLHSHSELQLLEQRFQSDFQPELKKEAIIVDKLSTYLTEDLMKLSISLEYHVSNPDLHTLFEIKINQTDISIEYFFIHDGHQHLPETKTKLQKIAKYLINRKNQQKLTSKLTRREGEADSQANSLQFSIIEQNENNKLSFVKEPSFINHKSESIVDKDEVLRSSQGDFAHLLSSRNFLSQADSDKNTELEQKISNHSREQPLSKANTDRITVNENPPQITEADYQSTTRLRSIVNHHKTSKGSKSSKSLRKSDSSHTGSVEYRVVLWIVCTVFILNVLLRMLG